MRCKIKILPWICGRIFLFVGEKEYMVIYGRI